MMRYLFATATLLALSLVVSTAGAQERLRYDVKWGDAKVADLAIDIGCPRGEHTPAALVAKSTGVANQIHSFDVRLDSFFVPGGRSLQGITKIVEEGEPRTFKSRFRTSKSVRVDRTWKGETTTKAYQLPGKPHDLLSWMLHLRTVDLSAGKVHRYWVWDGWKLVRLDARVGSLESVKTLIGTRKGRRIELTRTVLHHGGPSAFEPREDREELGTLWLGTDARVTPWAMTFDAPVGKARILLASKTHRTCNER